MHRKFRSFALASALALGCASSPAAPDTGSGAMDVGTIDTGAIDASTGRDAGGDAGATLPDTGCPLGEVDCGSGCVSVQGDDANCGACGMACATDETCMFGVCQPTTCPGGTTRCTGDCADTTVDELHCGTCDHACGAGEICEAGTCVLRCRAPLRECGMNGLAACVDTQTDPLNCGACGMVCPAGQSCSGGTCACRGRVTDCGGTCVDTSSDPENCGGCGVVCVRGACSAGACTCRAGVPLCGHACVDFMTDNANCGSCGHACARGTSCTSGTCAASSCSGGATLCSGTCVDLQGSTTNCGSCGHACAPGVTCITGSCGPPNDLRANAIPLTPSTTEVTVMGTTVGASFDGPTVPCACSSARNVWYSFELVAPGVVYLDTFNSGATNTEIHITSSTGVALPFVPFSGPFTPGACNDDAPCAAWGGASRTAVHLPAGTYDVAVGSCNPGAFTLHLQYLPDTTAQILYANTSPIASGTIMEGRLPGGSASSATCGGASSGEAAYWLTACGGENVYFSTCRSEGGMWERNDDLFGPYRDPSMYLRSATTGMVTECNDDALITGSMDCRGQTLYLHPVLLLPVPGVGGGQRGPRFRTILSRGLHALIVDENESSGGLDYRVIVGVLP